LTGSLVQAADFSFAAKPFRMDLRFNATNHAKGEVNMTKEEVLEKVRFHSELRGHAGITTKGYVLISKQYQDYYDKPATELDLADVQRYLHYLLTERKFAKATVNNHNSILRFLYSFALDCPLDIRAIPRAPKGLRLPDILTREEIVNLFAACKKLRDKAILMTTYSAGLRISEVSALNVADIDSAKMQFFIRGAKGDKDRFAMLSQTTLELLREYWKAYRPKDALFCCSREPHDRLGVRSLQKIFKQAAGRAGITKDVSMHSLRHSFATHLLEDGVGLFHIKKLLGHSRVETTCLYLHLVGIGEMQITNPLDKMMLVEQSRA
jgi:site-specific recombinase XerD